MTAAVDLGAGVTMLLLPGKHWCATVWPDGYAGEGERLPTEANLREATEQGYVEVPDPCWASLIEHEVLHTLISRRVFGTESPTLRHEAGACRTPYYERLYEESLVVAFQRWRNFPSTRLPALLPFAASCHIWLDDLRALELPL